MYCIPTLTNQKVVSPVLPPLYMNHIFIGSILLPVTVDDDGAWLQALSNVYSLFTDRYRSVRTDHEIPRSPVPLFSGHHPSVKFLDSGSPFVRPF